MKIDDVLKFAEEHHKGQFRKDGVTPYINHPLSICKKLHELGLTDRDMIFDDLTENDFRRYSVALMHDLLEDTDATFEEIEKVSDFYVASAVDTLTFKIRDYNNPFSKAKYLLDIANTKIDIVFEVKCVDRICNTHDFIANGDIRYAKIYFHKADALWVKLYEKAKENKRYKKLWNLVVLMDKEFKKGVKK